MRRPTIGDTPDTWPEAPAATGAGLPFESTVRSDSEKSHPGRRIRTLFTSKGDRVDTSNT